MGTPGRTQARRRPGREAHAAPSAGRGHRQASCARAEARPERIGCATSGCARIPFDRYLIPLSLLQTAEPDVADKAPCLAY